MGLVELRARTRAGECPFCGDPLAVVPAGRRGPKPKTCGDDACRKTAYHRLYKRDARARRRSTSDARSA